MYKLTLKFTTRKAKTDDNVLFLYLRIWLDEKKTDVALHKEVDSDKWDNKSQKAIGNTQESKNINEFLEATRFSIQNRFNTLLLHKIEVTPKTLVAKESDIFTQDIGLLEVFRDHNSKMEKAVKAGNFAENTIKKYRTLIKKVEEYIKYQYKQKDRKIGELDKGFINEFELYLKLHDHVGHNSTMKYITNLKKIIHICVNDGMLMKDPFKFFKTPIHDLDRDQLSESELLTIYKKEFDIESLNRIRDYFVFCCYTGLAYIDIKNLTWFSIQKRHDEKYWVVYSRLKTDNRAPVPLLPPALKILERYGMGTKKPAEKIFPVNTNQNVNAYLKTIAENCGISKRLHFHLARHTFATTITLMNGVPLETVGKMLGHQSARSTKIYGRIVDQKISMEMQTLQKKLTRKDNARKKAVQSELRHNDNPDLLKSG
jgi:site-specific recombinase XerD